MPSIIRELKNIQRVLSVVVRAGEKCFPLSNVESTGSEVTSDEFRLYISLNVFDENETISATGEGTTGKKCNAAFIKNLKKETKFLIKRLEQENKERLREIKTYGEAFTDSPAVGISACKMFLAVIDSIQI